MTNERNTSEEIVRLLGRFGASKPADLCERLSSRMERPVRIDEVTTKLFALGLQGIVAHTDRGVWFVPGKRNGSRRRGKGTKINGEGTAVASAASQVSEADSI